MLMGKMGTEAPAAPVQPRAPHPEDPAAQTLAWIQKQSQQILTKYSKTWKSPDVTVQDFHLYNFSIESWNIIITKIFFTVR